MGYTQLMSQFLSQRLIRNLLAVSAALFVTFMVFRGVSAFNDAMKMFSQLPVAQPVSCPEGLRLITSPKTGIQECIPAPSSTKGVVPVGIYPLRQTAPPPPPAPPAAPPKTP